MVKTVALLLLLLVSIVAVPPVYASSCRTSNGHLICILEIKRSAKNYWEYRAAVSVDGVARPVEVYDCRDRTRTQPDGTVIRFKPDDPGDLVCKLFR